MPDLFWVEIPRDVVRVAGPDAETFLQGQISQDIAVVRTRGSAWSFLLQPQGKVDAWLRVSTGDDEAAFVLDVDGGFGDAVIARLNRFKLRVKVDIEQLGRRCVAFRGDGASEQHGLAAEWPGIEGVDSIGDAAGGVGRRGTLDDYERARIEAGVPAMGREITAATIPAELGVNERSVSFTKGCYTGQELVARIDSRGGNVPRHLRGLRIDGVVPVGARVEHEGRDVGEVTSVVTEHEGTSALAVLARSVEPPAGVIVVVDGQSHAGIVRELPS